MMNRSVGRAQAEYAEAVRTKYGRYPMPGIPFLGFVLPLAVPLEGHEDDVIPKLPNYGKMKETEFAQLAINRADIRRRQLPNMPRQMRKMNWTAEHRAASNARKVKSEDVHGEA